MYFHCITAAHPDLVDDFLRALAKLAECVQDFIEATESPISSKEFDAHFNRYLKVERLSPLGTAARRPMDDPLPPFNPSRFPQQSDKQF